MYTPQTEPIPGRAPGEPVPDYPFIRFARLVIPLYARSLKFREPVMLHPERLVDAYRRFTDKKTRLVVGFRHAYGDDPQLMVYTFHHVLPKEARKEGKPVRGLPHVHFMYGAEVPLWSGPFVRWILPKAGAVPIDHVHMDAKGMNRIRAIVRDGSFPLALAPEGHVTYGSERIVALESGTARFCFWCIEDLARAGRTEEVEFLPLSTHYRYGRGIEKKLARFVEALELQCGIGSARGRKLAGKITDTGCPATAGNSPGSNPGMAARLRNIGKSILAGLASYYSEIGGATIGAAQSDILEAALAAAERMLAIETVTTDRTMDRLYRIRSRCWGKIYREDLDGMTPLERELACRETGEAWYAMRHMETVELLEYVKLGEVADGEPVERYVETANNYYDFLERLKGGTLRNRANAFAKYAVIVPGEPIVMNRYLDLYKTDKKGALQKATDDMKNAYETCIREYRNEYR